MFKHRNYAGLGLLLLLGTAATAWGGEPVQGEQPVSIVVEAKADRLEHLAGDTLAGFLGAIYPKARFVRAGTLPAEGRAVLLGTMASAAEIRPYVEARQLEVAGSFVVKTAERDGRQIGIIAGADPRAVLHAVYALAERLGYGFYISEETSPAATDEPLDFRRWELADAPLAEERIIFNWHNFLSSCSTWDLAEWKDWIRRSAAMRYTGVMVHAYGNNPMVSFTHNGQTKPVGYLTTTAKGRDWGTQHVNDVRLLRGARGVFDEAVFGSKAAMVPEGERAGAAKRLMKRVFAYARQQGMDVVFALDVDTTSSNPANIVGTLPESARLSSGGHLLANPDTPEGLSYYRAQLKSLLGDYPRIDRLVVWFRGGRTPWRNLKPESFPEAWKIEYRRAVAKRPEIAKHPDSPSMFAISKIARAFRKILDEQGRRDVKLGTGSWAFRFMAAADAFMPGEVAFIPLDTGIQFESPQVQRELRAVGSRRGVIPVVWAHHDDRTYIGRPYTPPPNFASQLEDCRAGGFGIIHWTTRPLDLYFKSLSEQTWTRTRDMPLEGTCRQMASRLFGPAAREAGGEYLYEWVTKAPQFGRETSDRFIDRPLSEPEKTIAACGKRLKLLEEIDVSSLDRAARGRLEYFKLLEQFFIEFHQNETALQKSIALLKEGKLAGAREAIGTCRPESVIELYARAAEKGGISSGEKALVISLNLRWLPYFEAQRQALGLTPVRINFQPTQHDPLAQGAGHRTFFVDPKRRFWLGLGEKETGVEVLGAGAGEVFRGADGEQLVCRTWIGSEKPIRLRLRNMIGGPLARGTHRVDLLLVENLVENRGPCELELVLRGSAQGEPVTDRIELARRIDRDRHLAKLSYTLRIDRGQLDVELKPVRGKVPLAGVVIEPLEMD